MWCGSCYHSESFCFYHADKFNVCLNCFTYGFPCLNCECDEGVSFEYDFNKAVAWLEENEDYYFNLQMNNLFDDF